MKKEYLGSTLFLLIIWQCVSMSIHNADIFLPSVIDVMVRLVKDIQSENFLLHVGATLNKTLISFIFALVLGASFGILSGISKRVEKIFRPYELLLKAIPNISYMFMLLLWVPKTSDAVYYIVFFILFPVFYSSTLTGVKNLDSDLKDVLRLYDETLFVKIWKIYLPQSMSYIKGAILSGISLGFKVCVMSEVLGSVKYGIGKAMYINKINLDMTGVFSWTIVIILLNLLLENLIKFVMYKFDK